MMRENGQIIVVHMKTDAGCEEVGLKLVSSKRLNKGKITRDISFECLESKWFKNKQMKGLILEKLLSGFSVSLKLTVDLK